MKMGARNLIYVLKNIEISMAIFVQFIVLKIVKMMKCFVPEQEVQSMDATAKMNASLKTTIFGEKLLDPSVLDGVQQSVTNMRFYAHQ